MSNRSMANSCPSSSAIVATSPAAALPVPARTRLLLEGPVLSTLLRLAAPNVLNLLAIAGMITFDGLFLGRLGADALAGVSLAFPFVMLIQHTAASGMGGGVSSAIARALGAGRRDVADALTLHTFVLALGLAAVFSTVLLLGAPEATKQWSATGSAKSHHALTVLPARRHDFVQKENVLSTQLQQETTINTRTSCLLLALCTVGAWWPRSRAGSRQRRQTVTRHHLQGSSRSAATRNAFRRPVPARFVRRPHQIPAGNESYASLASRHSSYRPGHVRHLLFRCRRTMGREQTQGLSRRHVVF